MKLPLVSVVIPTFNRANKVKEAVQSVLQQSYPNLEIIVVDDGSTDNTEETLKEFENKIQYFFQKNSGHSAARNHGVAKARGEIIAFLDSDDQWLSQKIAQQVELLTHEGISAVCCVTNTKITEGDGSSKTSFQAASLESKLDRGYWENPSQLIATRFLQFNTVVAIWKQAFEACGGFNEEIRILEDHDLAFRLSLMGKWAFISEPLVEKDNGTLGIGGEVMSNQRVHARYWRDTLKRLLQENTITCPITAHHLKRGVKEAEAKLVALDTIQDAPALSKKIGLLRLKYIRYRAAIRRRAPYWPKPKTIPLSN